MQIKKFKNGTHRSRNPQETFETIKPFLKTMGITRIANITGLDNIGIPVFTACRPNSKSLSVSQGKGHCLNSAKVSAVMESIEGFHAENAKLPSKETSFTELSKTNDPIINLIDLARSNEKDFDEDTIINWVQCMTLPNDQAIWVPFEVINAAFLVPEPKHSGYFISDSNGLASGNTMTEAINHALYEVIERDCLALWQLTPPQIQKEKRIDIDTIEDSFLLETITKLKSKNIHIGVWDLTNDIGIPTFMCKILSDKNIGIRPAYGSGSHLNKSVALSRAITEASQSRLTFIAGARDDQYHEIYQSEISNEVYDSWLDEFTSAKGNTYQSFKDIEMIDFEYLEQDQQFILDRLETIGLSQIVYADLTKKEFGISVVKVIVPGLEGITYPERRLLGDRGISYFNKYGVGACEMTS